MSPSTLRRTAIAVFVAILSVVLVTAGSATAAKLFTGKDIKNGSITGKDIKNKSIGKADLSAGATKSLTGPAGPAGPTGPAGATGPAGPAGPVGPAVLPHIYSAQLALEGLQDDTPETLFDLDVPSDRAYLITAKLNLVTTGVGEHTCELRHGAFILDVVDVTTPTGISKTPIMLTGVTASTTAARLRCTIEGPGSAQHAKLVVIPLGAIN